MDLAATYPSQLRQLLVCSAFVNSINFDSFRTMFHVDYSEPGTNYRRQEEETVYSFEVCLQKCDGKLHTVFMRNSFCCTLAMLC